MPPPAGLRRPFAISLSQTRADCSQFVEAIHRLFRGPGDTTQKQNAEQRIVERPRIVAEDRDEDAALARFERPKLRLGLAVLDAAGQQADALRIADELPVALIVEVDFAEIAGDGVASAGLEAQIERTVAEADRGLAGQADPLGEARRIGTAIYSPVDIHQSAAAREVGVNGPRAIGSPGAALKEDYYIGGTEIFGIRPFPCGRDLDAVGRGEQFGPCLLPGGVIVFAGSVVLRTGHEDDA